MNETIRAALEEKLGAKVIGSTPLSGGMVNKAARVETTDGPIFVKWKSDAQTHFFNLEAGGLSRLEAARALRVPKVLAFQDRGEEDETAFLALEWIEEHQPSSQERFKQNFAEGLAALHRDNPSPFDLFGLEHYNYLGAQRQENPRTASWPKFYRDCRIAVQRDQAREKGLLPPARALDRVMEKVEEIFADLDAKPVLIHGDLWSGNFLTADDEGFDRSRCLLCRPRGRDGLRGAFRRLSAGLYGCVQRRLSSSTRLRLSPAPVSALLSFGSRQSLRRGVRAGGGWCLPVLPRLTRNPQNLLPQMTYTSPVFVPIM